jgi:hypothetical protein
MGVAGTHHGWFVHSDPSSKDKDAQCARAVKGPCGGSPRTSALTPASDESQARTSACRAAHFAFLCHAVSSGYFGKFQSEMASLGRHHALR